MLPKAGAQNTEIVKNQEAQNTTFPCPGAYVRSILPEYTSETYSQRPCCCKPCCCSTPLLWFVVDLTAGQEHRTEKLSKTKKHRTQRFFVLEHMSAPYSQSGLPKHIPKGLAVVRPCYCDLSLIWPQARSTEQRNCQTPRSTEPTATKEIALNI